MSVWSEAVPDKGLRFDFFSDPLARKVILVTVQCTDSGMKGGTPAILYDLCLGLDTVKYARWNVFHAPVHSVCFIMDKAFCRMEHDDVTRKDKEVIRAKKYRLPLAMK